MQDKSPESISTVLNLISFRFLSHEENLSPKSYVKEKNRGKF